MATIDIIANANKTAVMVLEGISVEKINLLRLDVVARRGQLKKNAAGAVGGRAEYVISVNNWPFVGVSKVGKSGYTPKKEESLLGKS